MIVKNKDDIEGLKKIGNIVAVTVREMFNALEVGMTTRQLDVIGKGILDRFGARSAPRLCYGFEGDTIISINEEVAHALPSDRVICDGDMVNIDVSAVLGGYFADTGFTRVIGQGSGVMHDLCSASKEALYEGLKCVKTGNKLSLVEKAIRKVAKERNFVVVEDLMGHGIGRHIHEEPNYIPHYGVKDKRVFEEGSVLTIEPFLSTGVRRTTCKGDGWTLISGEGNYSAQFEHTVIVTNGDPIILTKV
jgi:methionyl aminopeptidase